MSDQHEREMPRTLTLLHVIASGVGIIVGAGIYVLLGPATQEAGGLVWLAFVISAAVCALTAMSYAELASMFTRTGGEYEYSSHVFGRTLTFMIGWAMLAGLVVAGATVSLGFARYASYLWNAADWVGGERGYALVVLVVSALLVAWGTERWSRVVIVLSALQVGGLLFVVVIGFRQPFSGNLLEGPAGSSFIGVMSAAALVFFAFIGFDEVATLSEETKDPTRTTPRALLWSLGISAGLYVLVSIAAVNVLGPTGLANSAQPLADVAALAVGDRAGSTMAVFAMVTTANTVLLVVTAASRMAFAMARKGDLPAVFARIDGRGVPFASIVGCTLAAAGFMSIGNLKLIASATDFAIYAVFLAVNVMVLVLRLREPERHRPFRTPWSVGRWPLLPILGLGATLWMMLLLDRSGVLVGLGIFASGAAIVVARSLRR